MRGLMVLLLLFVIFLITLWSIRPLLFDQQSNEPLSAIIPQGKMIRAGADDQPVPETLRTGLFVGLQNHQAEGVVKILKIDNKYYLRLEEDFSLQNGPDLYIYMGKFNRYEPKAKIARLKANKGSQNYQIPSDINPSEYNEVWVWCQAFSVPFAKASL